MAGDRWVMDIIWHSMLLGADALGDVLTTWSMEMLLASSFLMQLVLTFTAGFRWRSAGGRASDAVRYVVWLFYVGADFVATTALGHLSVSRTAGARRLVAFWAPFFLLHLGGPDSITAYELEDNELSARSVLELVLRVAGALYIVYKSIFNTGSLALGSAVLLMLAVGVAKYGEKILALRRANLANVRSSIKRKQQRQRRPHSAERGGGGGGGGGGSRRPSKPDPTLFAGDEEDDALVMKAHALFHVTKNLIVDSWVETETDSDAAVTLTKDTLFQLDWKQLCRVMEMELSLMYDFLYTKAAVIHTWHGYGIRALSPAATTVSLVLVELSNRGAGHKRSDVVITRVLLVATFLLETASLLRALASSWTGFLLKNKLRKGWFRHEALCTRRWQRFHRLVASFGRMARTQDHRRWSGSMGQLNVLHLVTSDGQRRRPAAPNAGGQVEDHQSSSLDGDVYQRYSEVVVIKQDVKELVFTVVKKQLLKLREKMKKQKESDGAAAPRPERGQEALRSRDLRTDLRWSLGDDLQTGILTWHIATDIFLVESSRVAGAKESSLVAQKVSTIRTLSNYMMYLLVMHPEMLPGLVTRKLFELTCEDLARIWSTKHHAPSVAGDLESPSPSPSSWSSPSPSFVVPRKFLGRWRVSPRLGRNRSNEEKFAKILRMDYQPKKGFDAAVNLYLSRGIELAVKLLELEKRGKPDMVEMILDVWMEMLTYAGFRCSKESHAKRLCHGGELTTILWLMAEHVGLFIVTKTSKGIEEDNWKRRRERAKGLTTNQTPITSALDNEDEHVVRTITS